MSFIYLANPRFDFRSNEEKFRSSKNTNTMNGGGK